MIFPSCVGSLSNGYKCDSVFLVSSPEVAEDVGEEGQEDGEDTTDNKVDSTNIVVEGIDIDNVENGRCKPHQSL